MNIESKQTTEAITAVPDRMAALQIALDRGVSPELLIQLGQQELPTLDGDDKRFIRWAGIATLAMVGGGVAASTLAPDVNVGETVRQIADLVFTPGNAPVAEATLKTVMRQAAQWGIYFGESSILIGYLLNGIRSRLNRSDQLKSLSDLQIRLTRAIEAGEAPIPMPSGYTAIDLGTSGDAIGRSIGAEIGWGQGSLPFIEGSKNVSGYDLWARLPNPSIGINKEEFFKSLDRVNFTGAKRFILCPVKEEQAFLPDVDNPDHFDLGFDEIIDRIRLLDEYSRMRGIPPKEMIIIADKYMERSVAPYTEGDAKIQPQIYTLEEVVNSMNKNRGEEAQIVIADPTDIVLDILTSTEYNPEKLPLEFFEDPHATELYGPRFVKRCRERISPIEAKTDGNPKTKSLRVTYGINDIGTAQTTGMLEPESTVAIIIDDARAVGSPYRSVILADAVKKWIIGMVIKTDDQQNS